MSCGGWHRRTSRHDPQRPSSMARCTPRPGCPNYRQRYRELTGETLPDPPPLPDVSELIPAAVVDLDGLIARLEPLLAQLDASFD